MAAAMFEATVVVAALAPSFSTKLCPSITIVEVLTPVAVVVAIVTVPTVVVASDAPSDTSDEPFESISCTPPKKLDEEANDPLNVTIRWVKIAPPELFAANSSMARSSEVCRDWWFEGVKLPTAELLFTLGVSTVRSTVCELPAGLESVTVAALFEL